MIQAEEDMEYCLEAALRIWRQVVSGVGTKATPPEAIAIIAVALFNARKEE